MTRTPSTITNSSPTSMMAVLDDGAGLITSLKNSMHRYLPRYIVMKLLLLTFFKLQLNFPASVGSRPPELSLLKCVLELHAVFIRLFNTALQ
ncbi:hypothetical protein VTN31DRAFT_1255 [Thermomyces dupontii]|uniref:uncharacterized protein n=1 Tax=Talaromyces thermophilus TaxID=28565 RepID=UPI003743F880